MNINSINLAILNQLNESANKNIVLQEYINIVKSSPLLLAEQEIYESFKTKHFKNDIIATNYINDKLKSLEQFKSSDLKKLDESLEKLVKKHQLNVDSNINNIDLDIHNVINETINNKKNIDVLYESISNIVDTMTTPNNITENVVKSGINEYNNKFDLSIEDINFVKTLSESNDNKKDLLKNLKTDVIDLINKTNDPSLTNVINETIQKINNTPDDESSLNENVINLYELKKELL